MLNVTARQIELLKRLSIEELEVEFVKLNGESYPLAQFKWETEHKTKIHGKDYYHEELAFVVASKQLDQEGVDAVAKCDR